MYVLATEDLSAWPRRSNEAHLECSVLMSRLIRSEVSSSMRDSEVSGVAWRAASAASPKTRD